MRATTWFFSLCLSSLLLAGCGGSSATDSADPQGTTNDSTAETSPTTSLSSSPPPSTTAGATTTAPAELTTTTTTVPAMGTAWVRTEPPIDVLAIAGTDDRLWVVGLTDGVHRLFHTDDLAAWTEVDLLAMGLELDGTPQAGVLPLKAMATSNEEEALFALAQFPVAGMSADSVSADVWLVRATDDTVELLSPELSGVDQRLSGPKNFRFSYFADSVRFHEQLTLVAGGRWWEPFSTADVDLSTITLSPDGTFTSWSVDESETFRPSVAGASDDYMIALGSRWAPLDSLQTRVSTDGVTWQEGGPIAPPGASEIQALAAAGIGDAVVVATRVTNPDTGTGLAFWTTDDGISWDPLELSGTLESPDSVSIHRIGEELVMVVGDFPDSELWRSDNGTDWTPIETVGNTPTQAGRMTVWDDRLVLHDGFATWVSPPIGDGG